MAKHSHQCTKETSLTELVSVYFRKESLLTCYRPLMQDVLVINTRASPRLINNADTLLHLLNGSFHSSHPCSFSGCWLLIFYEVHVFHLYKKGRKKMTKLGCNLHFSISKLWILSCPLILCCSVAVWGSCWLWRWKTLVWLLSKTRTTLNVTSIAKLFLPHFMPNLEVMIKSIWTRGEAPICLLCRRQQCQHSDPHEPLWGILL